MKRGSNGKADDPRRSLIEFRRARKLTQIELAKQLNCDGSHIGRIEAGQRNPGRRLAAEISRIIGIPSDAWDALGT